MRFQKLVLFGSPCENDKDHSMLGSIWGPIVNEPRAVSPNIDLDNEIVGARPSTS